MTIEIKRVSSRKELHIFIHLPAKIHTNHKNWVPPIYLDEWSFFNPKKNRAFDHCDTVLALAWKEGKPVGRIMELSAIRITGYITKITGGLLFGNLE
jgi:hypothetical protein